MKIDDALRAKLVDAVERAGGAREFSLRCGINAANISRYLRGIIRSIKDDNWEKLAPFLENSSDGGGAALPHRDDIIRATPELSSFIAGRMKLARINDVETLRQKIHFSSYELLRRQLSGKLNWFADTLHRVFEVLDADISNAPLSVTERQLLENAGIKRQDSCIMRRLPVIGGMEKGRPVIKGEVQIPLKDTRDLRAFHISGERMKPLLSEGDTAIFEVVSAPQDIPENSVVALRVIDRVSGNENFFCRRLHHLDNGKVILCCDNPEYGIIQISPADISWCAVLRLRISEFL